MFSEYFKQADNFGDLDIEEDMVQLWPVVSGEPSGRVYFGDIVSG
jgi:hypothetical protein